MLRTPTARLRSNVLANSMSSFAIMKPVAYWRSIRSAAHRYATDPNTSVLVRRLHHRRRARETVDAGRSAPPPEFIEAANNPNWIVAAHNAAFEMAIEQHILGPRFGWPLIPIERHVCTMAMALAMSLPAKLDAVARALELRHQKDSVGHRLMLMMSKPRKPHKDEDPEPASIGSRIRIVSGACTNIAKRTSKPSVNCSCGCSRCRLQNRRSGNWMRQINQRGFALIASLAEAARKIARAAAPEIDAELAEVTGGAVTSVNQVARLQAWLEQNGCTAEDLQKKTVEKLLEDAELSPKVQRALELRQDGGQAAVKKISTLLQRAGDRWPCPRLTAVS